MADFVAVLKKTIDSLADDTPAMREKVFEKARSTIEAKLSVISPPPPAAVADRQRKALEDAIAQIRAEYATKAARDPVDELEDVFASLKNLGINRPTPAAPKQPAAAPATTLATVPASSSYTPRAYPPLTPKPAETKPAQPPADTRSTPIPSGAPASLHKPVTPIAAPRPVPPAPEPRAYAPPAAPKVAEPAPPRRDVTTPVMPKATDPVLEPELDEEQTVAVDAGDGHLHVEPARRSRGRFGLIAATVALLVVAGGGYGIYVNRDDFASLAGFGGADPGEVEEPVETAEDLNETPPAEVVAEEPPAPEEEVAALPPDPAPAATPSVEPEKFTQRLMPDGSEVDDGPAGGPRSVGEGTSVAAVVMPAETAVPEVANDASPDPAGDQGAAPAAAVEQAAATAPAPAAVAVGQKAIFYEERTSSAQGSAETGNIVWSVVQESPGGDLPPEPAIRAEASIPGKDVQLRMTIRRNADQTLPASHIVEMIFLTPEGFEGGAIANVSRISFKETEQAAGNALIGIPAKIADGFFLIALGNAPAEIEANTTLLTRQSWIDIPITYESGRRALLSIEKGIPGDRVFQDALRAWQQASSG